MLFRSVISFFPSSELSSQANVVYVITLLVCWVISVAIPFIIYGLRHHWDGTVKKSDAASGTARHGGRAAHHAA